MPDCISTVHRLCNYNAIFDSIIFASERERSVCMRYEYAISVLACISFNWFTNSLRLQTKMEQPEAHSAPTCGLQDVAQFFSLTGKNDLLESICKFPNLIAQR